MGAWIKIALTVNQAVYLTQIDVDLNLEDILKEICDKYHIEWERGKFALKVKDSGWTWKTEYLTEENKKELRHGRELKLCDAPAERASLIIDKLYERKDVAKHLKNLASACKDSVMAKELHALDAVQHLRAAASTRIFSQEEDYQHFRALSVFLARGYIDRLLTEEVEHLMDLVLLDREVTRRMLLLAFDLLIQLRRMGNLLWPAEHLQDLIPYVRFAGEPKLQDRALQFLNHLYLYARDMNERQTVGEFMRSSVMIGCINKFIIRENLSQSIKQQLYLYQKVILTKYNNRLEDVNEREEKILEELGGLMSNTVSEQRKASVQRCRNVSVSSTIEEDMKLRERFRSLDNEDVLDDELKTPSPRTMHREISFESIDVCFDEDGTFEEWQGQIQRSAEQSENISLLALDNITYFIKNNLEGFRNILTLHNECLRSCLRLSISLTNLICSILEIRKEEPEIRKGSFVPLFFLHRDNVVEKLFTIVFRLFHDTCHDMKVAPNGDEYLAVLKVVEEQLNMGLEKEPREFLELEMRLKELNADVVMRERQRVIREDIERQLTQEPAFVELKQIVTPRIMDAIKEKRMTFMESGEHVPDIDYKGQRVIGKKLFLSMPKTRDKIIIEECSDKSCKGHHLTLLVVPISDIIQVDCGIKSNLYKEVCFNLYNERDMFFRPVLKQQAPDMGFPISLKLRDSRYVDFCAESQASMDYWVDGLNALLGLKMDSVIAEEEFDYLLDVELMMHLANLEGIKLPDGPPVVPPLPKDFEFSLP